MNTLARVLILVGKNFGMGAINTAGRVAADALVPVAIGLVAKRLCSPRNNRCSISDEDDPDLCRGII